MRLPNTLFARHRNFAECADAYADGELRGAKLRRFEQHLGGCEACQAAVAGARTLKTAVGALPEVAAPRSFQLTPRMVEKPAAAKQKAGTPLYLGLARAGAAMSVAVFAVVLVGSALDSGGSSGDTASFGDDDGRQLELSGAPAQDTFNTDDLSSTQAEAAGTPTAQLAPSTAGGVSGASLETPTQAVPQPPATGPGSGPTTVPEPVNRTTNDTIEPVPGAAGDAAAFEPYEGITSSEALAADGGEDDGFAAWTAGLGALAAASLVVLAVLEVSRRRRASA